MSQSSYLFSSESVTEGHPDKVADQISDAILDAIIAQDKKARVACETLVTTGMAIIAGEITTECWVDMPAVVRETIKEIGYNDSYMGFRCRSSLISSKNSVTSSNTSDFKREGLIAIIISEYPIIVRDNSVPSAASSDDHALYIPGCDISYVGRKSTQLRNIHFIRSDCVRGNLVCSYIGVAAGGFLCFMCYDYK